MPSSGDCIIKEKNEVAMILQLTKPVDRNSINFDPLIRLNLGPAIYLVWMLLLV